MDKKGDGVRTDMDNRIHVVDEKSKIDVIEIVKRVAIDFIIGGGCFGVLYYLISSGAF